MSQQTVGDRRQGNTLDRMIVLKIRSFNLSKSNTEVNSSVSFCVDCQEVCHVIKQMTSVKMCKRNNYTIIKLTNLYEYLTLHHSSLNQGKRHDIKTSCEQVSVCLGCALFLTRQCHRYARKHIIVN